MGYGSGSMRKLIYNPEFPIFASLTIHAGSDVADREETPIRLPLLHFYGEFFGFGPLFLILSFLAELNHLFLTLILQIYRVIEVEHTCLACQLLMFVLRFL